MCAYFCFLSLCLFFRWCKEAKLTIVNEKEASKWASGGLARGAKNKALNNFEEDDAYMRNIAGEGSEYEEDDEDEDYVASSEDEEDDEDSDWEDEDYPTKKSKVAAKKPKPAKREKKEKKDTGPKRAKTAYL